MRRLCAAAVPAALLLALLLPQTAEARLNRQERQRVLSEIERIEVNLLRADEDIRAATATIREMEADLRDLETALEQSGGRLEERQNRMALRLRAMYRLRHHGFLPLLFSAESPHQFLRVARYLWWIIKADQLINNSITDSLQASKLPALL